MKEWQWRLIEALDGAEADAAGRKHVEVEGGLAFEELGELLPLIGRVNAEPIGDVPAGCALFCGMEAGGGGSGTYRFSVKQPHAWNMVPTPEGWVEMRAPNGERPYPEGDLDRLP